MSREPLEPGWHECEEFLLGISTKRQFAARARALTKLD